LDASDAGGGVKFLGVGDRNELGARGGGRREFGEGGDVVRKTHGGALLAGMIAGRLRWQQIAQRVRDSRVTALERPMWGIPRDKQACAHK